MYRTSKRNGTTGPTTRPGPTALLATVIMLVFLIAACSGEGGDETSNGSENESGSEESPAAGSDADSDAAQAAADVFDRFNNMSGQERHDALVEAAEEEGAVVFYSTAPGWDPVLDAFQETYDIEIERYIGRSDTILQRVVQEYQAGVYNVDVFEDEAAALLHREEEITAEYQNVELTSQIPGYEPGPGLIPLRRSVPTVSWNTDAVADEDIPESIEDMADPTWEGRMAIDDGAWPWYTAIRDHLMAEDWTTEEVDEMFANLVANSRAQGNSIAMKDMLIAEEIDVGLGVLSQVTDRNKADGAPITWEKSDGSFVEPLVVQNEGAVLMEAAPHPAAALLLIDFLLSEGQEVLQSAGTHIPTAVPQEGGPLEGIPEDALQPVDPEKFYGERDQWSTRFDELLRGE